MFKQNSKFTNQDTAALICPICKKVGGELTVRESWLQAGGFGSIPRIAWVHIDCDVKEQRLLKSGVLKLVQLWVKRQDASV